MILPPRAINQNAPNEAAELNADLQAAQADLLKNPGNSADEMRIAIDQEELKLQQEAEALFLAGQNPDKCNQDNAEILFLEKLRPGGPLLASEKAVDNGLECYIVSFIRQFDPHFAPLNTPQGEAALASIQQILDRI